MIRNRNGSYAQRRRRRAMRVLMARGLERHAESLTVWPHADRLCGRKADLVSGDSSLCAGAAHFIDLEERIFRVAIEPERH